MTTYTLQEVATLFGVCRQTATNILVAAGIDKIAARYPGPVLCQWITQQYVPDRTGAPPMLTDTIPHDFLTTTQASIACEMSPARFRRRLKAGLIPHYRLGERIVRVLARDL